MNFEKFTIKAQEALAAAQSIASEHGHQSIEDFHLLSALLESYNRCSAKTRTES
jgi:ATP-dependent Clp protease ATP-binding subunit ClpB